MTQGTYTRPNDLDSCRTGTTNVFSELNQSPIDFLGKILENYPYLQLIPNSLLGIAVLYEYNTVKGSTDRLPWPEDLCGYIESVSDIARRDADLRANNVLKINGIPDTQYDPDECINRVAEEGEFAISYITGEDVSTGVHLPGSVSYGKCGENLSSIIEDLYNVDWTGYFSSPTFPTLSELPEDIQEDITEAYADTLAEATNAGLIAEAYPAGAPAIGAKKYTSSSPGPGWEQTGEVSPGKVRRPQWEYTGIA